MTKRYIRTSAPHPTHASTVDVLGSGPAQIMPRDESSIVETSSRPGCRVALRANLDQGIADSLLRYVNDFGQGRGTALVEDGLTWLELQFREDRDMLKSQFRDLLACPEGAHERGL